MLCQQIKKNNNLEGRFDFRRKKKDRTKGKFDTYTIEKQRNKKTNLDFLFFFMWTHFPGGIMGKYIPRGKWCFLS